MKSTRNAVKVSIITSNPDALREDILTQLKHGATIVPCNTPAKNANKLSTLLVICGILIQVNDLSAADEVTINLFEEFLNAETFTNEMLKCLIKTIYVYEDRRIEIIWNFKEKVV